MEKNVDWRGYDFLVLSIHQYTVSVLETRDKVQSISTCMVADPVGAIIGYEVGV